MLKEFAAFPKRPSSDGNYYAVFTCKAVDMDAAAKLFSEWYARQRLGAGAYTLAQIQR